MLATLSFAREQAETVIRDIGPLYRAHWLAVGHYRDLPPEPDFERYRLFERQGILRLYTIRDEDGRLKGYGVYLLGTALHYQDVLTAQESTIYVDPQSRPGTQFMDFIDAELKAEGVQIVTKHVKAKHDPRRAEAHLRLLRRSGYELQDYVLTKRLD